MIRLLPITRVIISHRPALIERADVVYRLDNRTIEQVRRPLAGSALVHSV
jgi:ABC-type bacteriocin/lantibiotic exporter with double-glycine peptidase domain